MKEEVNMNIDYYTNMNDTSKFFAFIPNTIAQVKTMLNINASQDIPYVLVYVKNVKPEYATSKMHQIADIVTKNSFYLRANGLNYTRNDTVNTVKTYCRNFFDNGIDYVANNAHDIEKEVDRINTDCWSRYDSMKNMNIDEEELIKFAIDRMNITQNKPIMKAVKHYIQEHINLDYSDEHVLYQVISDIASTVVNQDTASFDEVFSIEKKVYKMMKNMAEKPIANLDVFETTTSDRKINKSLADFIDKVNIDSLSGQDLWTVYSKWYATRTDKGKCIANYTKKDGLVYIPREEVNNAIKRYCSKNHIKIIRV